VLEAGNMSRCKDLSAFNKSDPTIVSKRNGHSDPVDFNGES